MNNLLIALACVGYLMCGVLAYLLFVFTVRVFIKLHSKEDNESSYIQDIKEMTQESTLGLLILVVVMWPVLLMISVLFSIFTFVDDLMTNKDFPRKIISIFKN